MSKSEINPEELLEDISKVFSIINKLEDTDNIEKINIKIGFFFKFFASMPFCISSLA